MEPFKELIIHKNDKQKTFSKKKLTGSYPPRPFEGKNIRVNFQLRYQVYQKSFVIPKIPNPASIDVVLDDVLN